MSQGLTAWNEIDAARRYSLSLLDDVSENAWFRQPAEGVTHVAWQVGHLAFAQYMLGLTRLRGELPEDKQIVPTEFLALFMRGSVPDPDPAKYPAPTKILDTLERIHTLVRDEVAKYTDESLGQPAIGKPHSQFTTKLGSLFWCARHEMLHGGQIGLLKRLLGASAKW
jgi:DinB superfamily